MVFKAIGKAIGGAVKSVVKGAGNIVKGLGKTLKGVYDMSLGTAFKFGGALLQGKGFGEAVKLASQNWLGGLKGVGSGLLQTAKGAIAVAPYVMPFMAGPALAGVLSKVPGLSGALGKLNGVIGGLNGKIGGLLGKVTSNPSIQKALQQVVGFDANKVINMLGGRGQGDLLSGLAKNAIMGNGKLDLQTILSVVGKPMDINGNGKLDAMDALSLLKK